MQKINLNFFKKNIAAIQAYNEKIKQKEKLKYYKKFDLFKNFCNICSAKKMGTHGPPKKI